TRASIFLRRWMDCPVISAFTRVFRRAMPGNNELELAAMTDCVSREAGMKGKTEMAQQRLGIIMNGVTGRMGTNQHLVRSILAIRAQGGVKLKNGDSVIPDPILLGRDEAKLAQLAKAHGIARWTTDLNAALK